MQYTIKPNDYRVSKGTWQRWLVIASMESSSNAERPVSPCCAGSAGHQLIRGKFMKNTKAGNGQIRIGQDRIDHEARQEKQRQKEAERAASKAANRARRRLDRMLPQMPPGPPPLAI